MAGWHDCRSRLCRPGCSPGLAPTEPGAELSEVVSPTLRRLPGTSLVPTAPGVAARPSPSVLFCVWGDRLCRERDLGDGRSWSRDGLDLFY